MTLEIPAWVIRTFAGIGALSTFIIVVFIVMAIIADIFRKPTR